MEIKAYPLDDTPYLADDLRRWQWGRTSGVYSADSNLQTVTNNNMSVTIRKGVAFLNGGKGGISTWIDADKVLTIETADGVLNRIDSIVVGWDIIGNKSYLNVVKGDLSSSPIARSPKRDNSVWEIIIARVKVNAGTTNITSAMITDMRLDESVCGLVRDGIQSIPTSALQVQARELIDNLEKAILDASGSQIIDGAITTSKIANGGVTTGKIADGGITTSKITDSGVTTGKIADKAVTADKIDTSVLLKIYPVGCIYTSIVNTNPSTLFGGTWATFATGSTIVGVDTTQTEFSTVSKTGGSKTHVLTIDQMPSHNHGSVTGQGGQHTHEINGWAHGYGTGYGHVVGGTAHNFGLQQERGMTTQANHTHTISSQGSSTAHNNLQPYITVYMWKRTA